MTYEWHEHDTDEINLIDLVARESSACIGDGDSMDVMLMHLFSGATGKRSANQLLVMKLMMIGKHDKDDDHEVNNEEI